jgi:hypothetical protein
MNRVTLLALLVALAAASPARADVELARGEIVKIEPREIYINLGTKQGLTDGLPLRLKRPIRLKHPVTRAVVEDWVPIGVATITSAGASLSRAVIGELTYAVRMGDRVEVLVERAPPPSPAVPPNSAPSPSEPTAPAAPVPDPATVEVLEVFGAQLGQPVEARIAGWERFLSMRASSPYAEELRRELVVLRRLRDELASGGKGAGSEGETVSSVQHHAASSAVSGVALPLVFVLDQPERVASAYLHYRASGARTFRSVLLTREHDIYLRGTLPAEVLTPPGLDYFVEVSTPSGRSGLAIGSPAAPVQVEVEAPPLADAIAPAPGRSSVKLAVDYLDFATLDRRRGDRTDRVVNATVDFTYRLRGPVDSIGVGYGALTGQGGYADAEWTELAPAPRTGFQYGYADLELGTADASVPLALGVKLIAGVGREGFGLGAEGRLRLGGRDAANLLLSASTISQVGFLSDIRFGVPARRDLRFGLSVGATDRPGRGDIGARFAGELEWLGLPWISLLLRASWQGRNIDHRGVGGGAGIGAYW